MRCGFFCQLNIRKLKKNLRFSIIAFIWRWKAWSANPFPFLEHLVSADMGDFWPASGIIPWLWVRAEHRSSRVRATDSGVYRPKTDACLGSLLISDVLPILGTRDRELARTELSRRALHSYLVPGMTLGLFSCFSAHLYLSRQVCVWNHGESIVSAWQNRESRCALCQLRVSSGGS